MKKTMYRARLGVSLLVALLPVTGDGAPPQPVAQPMGTLQGFNRTLSLQGITFEVSTPNTGAINTLLIHPSGLKGKNEPIQREIEGTVTHAEVADLNSDGSPELYIYVTSTGSGSYGSVVAYASNKNKSLTEIYMPPLQENARVAKGYMGHDTFRVVEGYLVRTYPIYTRKDANAQPTGGTRQVQYTLKAGEAGWLLRIRRTLDY